MANENRHIITSLLGAFTLISIVMVFSICNILLTPVNPNFFSVRSNNYAKNSAFNNLTYSIAFTSGDIVINDKLEPSQGYLNGNFGINSTIVDNSTASETKLGYICLYGTARLTLNNVSDNFLTIVCYDNSILKIQNSFINIIYLFDESSAYIKNSTVSHVYDRFQALNQIIKSYDSQDILLSINNDSKILEVNLRQGGNFYIENVTINSLLIGSSSPLTYTYISKCEIQEMAGIIQNSTIINAEIGGKTSLNFYGSNITSISTFDHGRVVLNQSHIGILSRGIIAYGDVSINNNTINGTEYLNTTQVINSTIISEYLGSVTANNTASINITNTNCKLTLYDSVSVVFSNLTLSNNLVHNLFSLSSLKIKNVTGTILNNLTINSFNKSSIEILQNSSGINLFISSSGYTFAYNSSLISIYPQGLLENNLINNIRIINCSILTAYCFGSSTIHLENCSISSLKEGITCTSGNFRLNQSGIVEFGNHYNKTTLLNNNITERSLSLIEINGTTNFMIEDIINEFNLVVHGKGNLFIRNSTYNTILATDEAYVSIDNSSNIGINPLILAMAKSEFSITGNSSVENIKTLDSAQISSEFSVFQTVDVLERSSMVMTSVNSFIINIGSNVLTGYAFQAYECNIQKLYAMSLGPS